MGEILFFPESVHTLRDVRWSCSFGWLKYDTRTMAMTDRTCLGSKFESIFRNDRCKDTSGAALFDVRVYGFRHSTVNHQWVFRTSIRWRCKMALNVIVALSRKIFEILHRSRLLCYPNSAKKINFSEIYTWHCVRMCRYLPNVANVCFKIQLNMLLISMNAAKDVDLQKSVPIRPKTDKFA